MESSLWFASRNTHLKIIAVSFMAVMVVLALGAFAKIPHF